MRLLKFFHIIKTAKLTPANEGNCFDRVKILRGGLARDTMNDGMGAWSFPILCRINLDRTIGSKHPLPKQNVKDLSHCCMQNTPFLFRSQYRMSCMLERRLLFSCKKTMAYSLRDASHPPRAFGFGLQRPRVRHELSE